MNFFPTWLNHQLIVDASHLEATDSMDIDCTVRGRVTPQGKEVLTHHFLLYIVRTKELLELSTLLVADPEC